MLRGWLAKRRQSRLLANATHVVEDSIPDLVHRNEWKFALQRIAIDLTVIESLLRKQQYQAAKGNLARLIHELEEALK